MSQACGALSERTTDSLCRPSERLGVSDTLGSKSGACTQGLPGNLGGFAVSTSRWGAPVRQQKRSRSSGTCLTRRSKVDTRVAGPSQATKRGGEDYVAHPLSLDGIGVIIFW